MERRLGVDDGVVEAEGVPVEEADEEVAVEDVLNELESVPEGVVVCVELVLEADLLVAVLWVLVVELVVASVPQSIEYWSMLAGVTSFDRKTEST